MFWPSLILAAIILGSVARGFMRGMLEYLELNRPYLRSFPRDVYTQVQLSALFQQLIEATNVIEESFDNNEYGTMFVNAVDLWTNFLYYLGKRFIPQHVETMWFWGAVFVLSPISGISVGWRWLTTGCVKKHHPLNNDSTHVCLFSR